MESLLMKMMIYLWAPPHKKKKKKRKKAFSDWLALQAVSPVISLLLLFF